MRLKLTLDQLHRLGEMSLGRLQRMTQDNGVGLPLYQLERMLHPSHIAVPHSPLSLDQSVIGLLLEGRDLLHQLHRLHRVDCVGKVRVLGEIGNLGKDRVRRMK